MVRIQETAHSEPYGPPVLHLGTSHMREPRWHTGCSQGVSWTCLLNFPLPVSVFVVKPGYKMEKWFLVSAGTLFFITLIVDIIHNKKLQTSPSKDCDHCPPRRPPLHTSLRPRVGHSSLKAGKRHLIEPPSSEAYGKLKPLP